MNTIIMETSEIMKENIDLVKENNNEEDKEIVSQKNDYLVNNSTGDLELIENSNIPTTIMNLIVNKSNLYLRVENPIRISIENDTPKIPIIQVDSFGLSLEDYSKENLELKKINEILEREINLLKSLILINNLNLNTSDFKPLYKENYFVEMCNEDNLSKVISNDKLYNQQDNLHVLQLKINNLKMRLDLFKKELEEEKKKFTDDMNFVHCKIIEFFNNEIKMRKMIENKVSSIKKLI